ncbi:MAG: ectonucleotide pyrophosphatase/phosphodiesterase [Clostridium sp.]
MNNLTNKHLVVISIDGLKAADFDIINNLPNFSRCIQRGTVVRNVKSIYPSLTYPAHTTIVTGKYPKNHGVVNNKLLEPKKITPDWFWFRKYVNGPTLYDVAKEKGLSVASIFWPVTGKASIKYNIPEIFSNNKYISQEMSSLMGGSLLYQLGLNRKFRHMLDGFKEPNLDNFATTCAVETIKKYKPNLLLLHLLDLDSQRHGYGTDSKEAIDALHRHDIRLSKIISALEEANIYENSSIVILGDHGFQDFNKIISLNTLFKNQDLISVDEKNKIKSWRVYAKSCDGSAYIYLKDDFNKALSSKIYSVLNSLSLDSNKGIQTIYKNEDIISLGGDPKATFMIEAKKGFIFTDKFTDNIITSTNPKEGKSNGNHGYHPDNPNIHTLFIGCGDEFKQNFFIDKMNLVDIAPTLSKVLGIKFPKCDGQVIDSILTIP